MTADPAALLRLAADDAPDADLLARFAAGRDEGAFAALVRRHGGTVLGVCRRMTGHRQDAEDAFQAVFLVLARKADRIDRPALLGNWLYGVAVRVAGKARRRASRWREATLPDLPQPEGAVPDPDLAQVIDEELARLPAWYRDAVLLCDLHGLPRADAAKRLGVPEGTLSSRLATGRKKLADRLARRGVTAPAAGLAAALGGSATADVPAELVQRAVSAAVAGVTGGAVPAAVLHLASGGTVMGTVFGWVGATAAVGLTVGAVAAWPGQPPKAESPKPVAATKPDTPQPERPATNGQKASRLKLLGTLTLPGSGSIHWHPDGRTFAIEMQEGLALVATSAPDGSGPGPVRTVIDLKSHAAGRFVGFHPKLSVVVTHKRSGGNINAESKLHFWRFAKLGVNDRLEYYASPSELRAVDLDPDDGYPRALTPDGKAVLCQAVRDDGTQVFRLIDSETGDRQGDLITLPAGRAPAVAFSPGGERLMVVSNDERPPANNVFGQPPDRQPRKPGSVVIECVSVPTGRPLWSRTLVEPTDRLSHGNSRVAISPDGKRLLVTAPAKMGEHRDVPIGLEARQQHYEGMWKKIAGDWEVLDLNDPKDSTRRERLKLIDPSGKKASKQYLDWLNEASASGKLTKKQYLDFAIQRHMAQQPVRWTDVVDLHVLDAATGDGVCKPVEPNATTVVGYNFSHDGRFAVGTVMIYDAQGMISAGSFSLRVWDATTGAVVKSWTGNADARFAPDRPVLSISEVTKQWAGQDGQNKSQSVLGLWDVAPLWK